MSRPVIGLTADVLPVSHRRKYTVYNTYVELVRRAGALPLGLFPGEHDRLDDLLDRVDGLLLPGGDDMHPRHWGESEVHPSVTLSAEERTLLELALVREAARSGLPLLGVCLGHQALNVAFGGTVIQHLDPALGHGVGRESRTADNEHDILVEEGTRLREILGGGRVRVNSGHHQAVGRVGDGLVVSARAPDGVVEAIEGKGAGFLIGIQWHPEERPDDPVTDALLQALIQASQA
jgi:putative glutamine amidotransferase